ncbi:hypothetical protein [Mucilaginibacter sp. Mucisp84]|uniref:hypothetical protein n=1 Tax=Mucilaginibacter sp. Mucisp84 TaxID=3243058 RepID=UPI0039A5888F
MKKRKAKRRKLPPEAVDNRIAKAITEQDRIKEAELLELIAQIIVNATLRELYGEEKE